MYQPPFDPRPFPLFDALAEPQRLVLQRLARQSSVPRRQRIYSVGDPGGRVYFLETGVVKVAAPLPAGPEILLAFLYPGDIFGESALIDDGPRDHLTQAYEDAKVWSVSRNAFLDLLGQSPALGPAVFRLMARGTRRFRLRVEELLQKNAYERVAQTLLNLAGERSVADADGLLIPLRLTQADLASMTGLARETVNVVLGKLRARGLVEMTRDSIRLRQPATLSRVVRSIQSPIRSEVREDRDLHVRSFGGAAARSVSEKCEHAPSRPASPATTSMI